MIFGITGIPKSGKTTIFNLLTGAELDTSKFSATIEEMNRGQSKVPDPRIDELAVILKSKKKIPVVVDYLDFAGIALGGERESKLVGELRTLDAIVHVLRAFEDDELPHPAGSINPKRDAQNFLSELIINDLVVVESRLERVESMLGKLKDDKKIKEKELLLKVKAYLEDEKSLRDIEFDESDAMALKGFGFLSMKPLLFALNVSEDESADLGSASRKWGLEEIITGSNMDICPLCAQIEEEISRLDAEERQMFMEDLGISDLGGDRLMLTAFRLLGMITFFTGSENETHAWSIPQGSNAVHAAGAIHTDLARGFIRAEVVNYKDLIAAGSVAEAKNRGAFHLHGRDYTVQDGDYVLVRFNV